MGSYPPQGQSTVRAHASTHVSGGSDPIGPTLQTSAIPGQYVGSGHVDIGFMGSITRDRRAVAGGGAITVNAGNVAMVVGTANSDKSHYSVPYARAHTFWVKATMIITANGAAGDDSLMTMEDGSGWATVGLPPPTGNYIAIGQIENTYKAICAAGTTTSQIATPYDMTASHTYEIVLYIDGVVEFFQDGVSAGTISTNVPAAALMLLAWRNDDEAAGAHNARTLTTSNVVVGP